LLVGQGLKPFSMEGGYVAVETATHKAADSFGGAALSGRVGFRVTPGVWGAAGCAPTLCDRAVLRLEAEAGLEFDDAAGEGAEALAEG
jgi:hypothetical protein